MVSSGLDGVGKDRLTTAHSENVRQSSADAGQRILGIRPIVSITMKMILVVVASMSLLTTIFLHWRFISELPNPFYLKLFHGAFPARLSGHRVSSLVLPYHRGLQIGLHLVNSQARLLPTCASEDRADFGLWGIPSSLHLIFVEDGVLALVGIFLDQVDSLGSPFPTLFYSKRYNSVIASLLLLFDYDMALLSGKESRESVLMRFLSPATTPSRRFCLTIYFDGLLYEYQTELHLLASMSRSKV